MQATKLVSCGGASVNFSRQRLQPCRATHSHGDHANSRIRQSYRLLTEPASVGAEHGQGFDNFRNASPSVRVDVDNLNEQLKATGFDRHRQRLKPDEAFGMIFSFEGVVANTKVLQAKAWSSLAKQEQLVLPDANRPQLSQVSPERAIMEVLNWTKDINTAKQLAWKLACIYTEHISTLARPNPGITEWLQLLAKYNIPCALVTRMDRQTVRSALERMALHDYLPVVVAAEDDMETEAQRLLAAAMRLRRPPNLCVGFASCPAAITAAHNCTMKSVAVHGESYKAWELKAADLTVSRLDELSVYNLRRLFANSGEEFMDTKLQHARPDQYGYGSTGRPRRVAAGTLDPADY